MSCSSLLMILRHISHWTWILASSKPQWSFCLVPINTGVTETHGPHSTFYIDAWDLNSGPHSCIVRVLTHQPICLIPSIYHLWVLYRKLSGLTSPFPLLSSVGKYYSQFSHNMAEGRITSDQWSTRIKQREQPSCRVTQKTGYNDAASTTGHRNSQYGQLLGRWDRCDLLGCHGDKLLILTIAWRWDRCDHFGCHGDTGERPSLELGSPLFWCVSLVTWEAFVQKSHETIIVMLRIVT